MLLLGHLDRKARGLPQPFLPGKQLTRTEAGTLALEMKAPFENGKALDHASLECWVNEKYVPCILGIKMPEQLACPHCSFDQNWLCALAGDSARA